MKIICIYHSRDLDGWMSSAIVKKWFEENHDDPIVYSHPYKGDHTIKDGIPDSQDGLSMLGWDYGGEIPDLSGYDKVIMVDVAFPSDVMIKLRNSPGHFMWIDHHKSAIIESVQKNYQGMSGTRNDKFAACELTWQYLFPGEKMPEIVRLLGRYDCFGYKGTDEEQEVLEFQYGARAYMSNYEDCYTYLQQDIEYNIDTPSNIVLDISSAGKFIYKYLCTEARQTYKKAFPVKFSEKVFDTNAPYPNTFRPRKFLCVNQERFNPVNFGIDYHKDGYDGFACFWLKEGKWHWSLYNDNGKVDCSVIAKQYGGGGHFGASGFVCNTETLMKIILSQ